MQGESQTKEKPKDFHLFGRAAAYLGEAEIVQTEGNGQRKAEGFCLAIAEVQPILAKQR